MASIPITLEGGKRIDEYESQAAVASGNDTIMTTAADGTGQKNLAIDSLKEYVNKGKQDTLSEDQMAAANSGANADIIGNLFTGIYIQVKTGKNLGNGLTTQQKKKISDGDFYGLNIGDYWEANGNKFRIWQPNWYKGRGDQGPGFTQNHLIIMPDANILKADGSTTHYMNTTDSTSGGYAGTGYRANYKAQCLKAFTDVFGTDHIAKYRGLISNATASGAASGWTWYDCDVELPSEEMMYGAHHWSTSGDSGSSGYNAGSFWGQLALAQIAPEFVVNRENYWLQDVAAAAWFANVGGRGYANGSGASYAWVGVRPFALLI